MIVQIVSLIGALLILAGFAGLQFGRTHADAPAYLWCNFIGAGLLTAVGWIERQWGFLLLESVWCAVAAWALLRMKR